MNGEDKVNRDRNALARIIAVVECHAVLEVKGKAEHCPPLFLIRFPRMDEESITKVNAQPFPTLSVRQEEAV